MHESSVAVDGFDVVAYRTQRRAVKGSADKAYSWGGKRWYFASAEHRDLFARDPERFAPRFDGHCAFATSLGKSAPGSPRHWVVVGDRLFLQSNAVARLLFRLLPGRARAAEERWRAGQTESR